MSSQTITSNDLIDDLVRTYFGVEPDVMAALAHGDEQVSLRRLPGARPTIDPLDGLDVLMRRILAIYFRMRRHKGAVSLVSEAQAREAGWPTARLANMAVVIAWALVTLDLRDDLPILLEADEDARAAASLVDVGANLPSYDALLVRLQRAQWKDGLAVRGPDRVSRGGTKPRPRRLASLRALTQAWLGVDPTSIELPADRWRPRSASGNARAADLWSWIVSEAMDLAEVLEDEDVRAVRLKTELDANLAGHPGAAASNFVLLLGAAIDHGAGTTVCVLPPSDEVAAALIATSESIASRAGEMGDDAHALTLASLALKDAAARNYVHVGRRAAARVGLRLLAVCTEGAVPQRSPTTAGATQ